jgi:hypothetical protein
MSPRSLSGMLHYLAAEAAQGRQIPPTVLRLCAERAREHEDEVVVDLRQVFARRYHADHLHGDGDVA